MTPVSSGWFYQIRFQGVRGGGSVGGGGVTEVLIVGGSVGGGGIIDSVVFSICCSVSKFRDGFRRNVNNIIKVREISSILAIAPLSNSLQNQHYLLKLVTTSSDQCQIFSVENSIYQTRI